MNRLQNESPKAFEAFDVYASLGASRSHDAVANQLHKNKSLISRWASRFKWKERIIQWDLEHADISREAEEKVALETAREKENRRDKVQDNAWEMFEKLLAKAKEMLAFPVSRETTEDDNGRKVTIVEPIRWRFGDIARIAEIADGLGRMACGMPAKVTGLSDVEGKPFTMPTSAVPTNVIVNVMRTDASDAEVKLYGERPADDRAPTRA